ncbi:MAG: hypothetical protein ACOZAR_04400 [Patescibacteria group bacterium]
MNNKLLTGLITGGAILTTAASAYAFSPQSFDSIKTALTNNDYSSWVTAMSDAPNSEEILAKINESNFSQLVEAHNLMQSGNKDEAKAIMEELGINGLMGRGGQGPNGANNEQMEAMKTALNNSDYEAWKTAVSELPNSEELLSKINESNFSRLVEAHNLQQQAQAIREELGIEGFGPRGKGGKGPKDGSGFGNQNNLETDSSDTSDTNI